MPPDLRELGPAYRAANASGTTHWLALQAKSRQEGAAAQPYRNRMTFSMLESIKVPTLLITGDADMYAPPPLLQMFAARIKGSQSLIIPEAGHSSYWRNRKSSTRRYSISSEALIMTRTYFALILCLCISVCRCHRQGPAADIDSETRLCLRGGEILESEW
jgi:hypothetical protein